MTGLFIIAHAPLASALRDTAAHAFPEAAEALVVYDVPADAPREQPGVRVLAGVNVPMLWRALNYRQKPLDDLVALALAGASQGVMQVAVSRPQNQALRPASHDPNHRDHQQ